MVITTNAGLNRYKVMGYILSTFLCVGCAGFWGQAGRVLVSEEEERRLGMSFHQHLLTNDTARQQYPVYVPRTAEQEGFQNYAQEVFREVLTQVPDEQLPDYPFTLTIIESEEENAFAVPGGYVYLTTGIIRSFQNESELAAVLGHEIAHITDHHFREALAKNVALASALQVVLAGTGAGQVGQMAAGTFHQLAGLRFSRGNEADADRLGTLFTGRAGRNPLGIATYFQRQNRTPIPQFLSSHPGPENRVDHVREIVEKNPKLREVAADSTLTNYRERFQARMPW